MEKPDIALATSMEPPTEDTKKEFARVRVMLLCWNITSDMSFYQSYTFDSILYSILHV